jgi:hypothetical protein
MSLFCSTLMQFVVLLLNCSSCFEVSCVPVALQLLALSVYDTKSCCHCLSNFGVLASWSNLCLVFVFITLLYFILLFFWFVFLRAL